MNNPTSWMYRHIDSPLESACFAFADPTEKLRGLGTFVITPLYAAPIPTEQASDVLSESALRAALLTAWDDGYRSPSTYNDVDANTDAEIDEMRKNDIDHLMSFIKSATPADKGNAPAEGKL